MGPVENLTPYGAAALSGVTREGDEVRTVLLAAHFPLPPPGRRVERPLIPTDEQPAPVTADVYWGEPGASSLRYEGLTAYTRNCTDIHIQGSAWAPGGRPVTSMDVSVAVGACRKTLRVHGDRIWLHRMGFTRASSPAPFVTMPLRWERALGGDQRNPVGRSVFRSAREADGAPVPNIEFPHSPITDPCSRSEPAGIGPIAKHWSPRASFAGTYDEAWVAQRAPLWPEDLDLRFFQSAAPGLTAPTHLVGGEDVVLDGFAAEGTYAFTLPRLRLVCKSVFRTAIHRQPMTLDVVVLEPDQGTLTLLWRATVPFSRQGREHEYTSVRELETWEAFP